MVAFANVIGVHAGVGIDDQALGETNDPNGPLSNKGLFNLLLVGKTNDLPCVMGYWVN